MSIESISIFKLKVDYIPFKGDCLFYDITDNETGAVFHGGVISLDLNWINPSSRMPGMEHSSWHSVSYCPDIDEYRYSTKYGIRRVIAFELINAVLEVVVEKELLGERDL